MKTLLTKLAYIATLGLVIAPTLALAQGEPVISSTIETTIKYAEYFSLLTFIVGTILFGLAVKGFGKSTLGSIFFYFFVATGIFIFISIFLGLGYEFFGIAEESNDVWWHFLFYTSFLLYFAGLYKLVGLGNGDTSAGLMSNSGGKTGGILGLIVVAIVFIAPGSSEGIMSSYTSSSLAAFGLHHFIAFALAALVAIYLVSVKNKLGQIGQSIANPILIAVSALSLQHLWELLTESWKVFAVQGVIIEGVEQIFLIIAGLTICYSALRLTKFTKSA